MSILTSTRQSNRERENKSIVANSFFPFMGGCYIEKSSILYLMMIYGLFSAFFSSKEKSYSNLSRAQLNIDSYGPEYYLHSWNTLFLGVGPHYGTFMDHVFRVIHDMRSHP